MIEKIISFIVVLALSAHGEIVINEVMVNEPGSYTTLEWIELYNYSSKAINLDSYSIIINNDINYFPAGMVIQPQEYIIICRNLYKSDNSFEKWFGNGSGIWGDTITEQYFREPIVMSFSLNNSSGMIVLFNNENMISQFTWSNSGVDGVSWERVDAENTLFGLSSAVMGHTAGESNSVSLIQNDLAIDSIHVESNSGVTSLVLYVTNYGLNQSNYGMVYLVDDKDTLSFMSFDRLYPEQQAEIKLDYEHDGLYAEFFAALQKDNRVSNSTLSFMSPGRAFPPLLLSEVLANPTGMLNSEWIEIYNRYDSSINMQGWSIRDASGNKTIISDSAEIMPDGYFLMIEDSVSFLSYYENVYHSVSPNKWPSFNNNGDKIYLADKYGIVADRFYYDDVFDNNHTWGKDELSSYWGKSKTGGGTPGVKNEILVQPVADNIIVDISPEYFNPTVDGQIEIIIDAPMAASYSSAVYDKKGRRVKTFIDEESFIPRVILWDGLTDTGREAPAGIYMFYFEAADWGAIKKPMVIVR